MSTEILPGGFRAYHQLSYWNTYDDGIDARVDGDRRESHFKERLIISLMEAKLVSLSIVEIKRSWGKKLKDLPALGKGIHQISEDK